MDATMTRGRSKGFNCFKPIADDDDNHAALRKKNSLRRSFSAALKVVLFKSSLLRKSRSENSKDYEGRKSNFLCRSKRSVDSVKKNPSGKPPLAPEEIFRINSDRSSIFSTNTNTNSTPPSLASSSSVSSCSSHSRSESDKLGRSASLDLRQMNQQKRRSDSCGRKLSSNNYNFVFEMCVLLVCLGALVWGKVFAIVVCTSAWLFFAPASHRHQRPRRISSFDSEENKKREGLLERNR